MNLFKIFFKFICKVNESMLNFFFEMLGNWILFSGSLVSFSFLDLLHYCLLVSLLCDHAISFFQCFNQNIDSSIELVQIVFHIFFLTCLALLFFVWIELIKCIFLANILELVKSHIRMGFITWIILLFPNLIIISLRTGVFLLH